MKSIRLLGATLLASTTLLGAGQAFAASEPSTPDPANAQTPVNTALTINDTPTAPEPPQNPDGGTDEGTGITGLFGIAYAPKALSGTTQLQEQGETEVSLSNNSATNDQNKYNVGVQDKTRAKDRDWSLTAQLEWTGDTQNYLAGSTITATGGNVKLNDGQGNLSEVADSEVTIGDMATDVTISQDAPVEIMKANAGKTVNGVYNYQFQNPKLVVQNSENVAAGTYSGNIVWNLSSVPGNEGEAPTPPEEKRFSFVVNNYKSPETFASWEEAEEARHVYVMDNFNNKSEIPTSAVTNAEHGALDIPSEHLKYKVVIKDGRDSIFKGAICNISTSSKLSRGIYTYQRWENRW
ncbi:WxL domain-containing protein [Enterococcus hirae]